MARRKKTKRQKEKIKKKKSCNWSISEYSLLLLLAAFLVYILFNILSGKTPFFQ